MIKITYVGFEKDKHHYEAAIKRLSEHKAQRR